MGGEEVVGGVQSRGLGVCAPRLPGFVLLVGFSGALLGLAPVGAVGLGWPGGGLFWPVGGGVDLRSGVYAAGGLRWRFACGFGFRHCL